MHTEKENINLTDREIDVFKLLAKFKENNEIADILHISLSTVKAHISSILIKLNVLSRAQAVICGIKLGLINIDDIEIKKRSDEYKI